MGDVLFWPALALIACVAAVVFISVVRLRKLRQTIEHHMPEAVVRRDGWGCRAIACGSPFSCRAGGERRPFCPRADFFGDSRLLPAGEWAYYPPRNSEGRLRAQPSTSLFRFQRVRGKGKRHDYQRIHFLTQ